MPRLPCALWVRPSGWRDAEHLACALQGVGVKAGTHTITVP
jgi:hypothetical protein